MMRKAPFLLIVLALAVAAPLAAQRTAGLRPTGEDVVGNSSSDPGKFVILGDRAYFIARGIEGVELRWTDGTNVGLVKAVYGVISRDLAKLGDHLYFFVSPSFSTRNELWKSDGTAAGTVKVKEVPYLAPYGFWQIGNVLVFYFDDSSFYDGVAEIWRTDGTADGTFQVKKFDLAGTYDHFGKFTASGNYVYFSARSPIYEGAALYRTDGTVAGTIRLVDAKTLNHIDYNGALYFSDPQGPALMKSDGTVAGTVIVRMHFDMEQAAVAGGSLYMRASSKSLYKSDGTAQGTTLVKRFEDYPFFDGPIAAGSRVFLFLYAAPGSASSYVVASDGTALGTVALKYIEPFNGDSRWTGFGGDLFFFQAADREHGNELWRSDATPGGTFLLKDIDWRRNADGWPWGSAALPLSYWNGAMYFSARDVRGWELWRTDGTPEGTRILANINPDGAFSGRVTGVNGAPIPNAKVSVVKKHINGVFETAMDYPVDSEGNYSAEGLIGGSYIAFIELPGYAKKYNDGQTCPRCDLATVTTIPVFVGQTTPHIDFTLERTGAISGTVRHAQTQAGIGGIAVRFSDQKNGFVYATVVTGSDGRYTTTMTLPPGIYAGSTMGTPTVPAVEYIGFYCGVGRGPDDFTPIPVEPAQTTQAVDFVVSPVTP